MPSEHSIKIGDAVMLRATVTGITASGAFVEVDITGFANVVYVPAHCVAPDPTALMADDEPFRPVAEMSYWELAQAAVINMAIGTSADHAEAETEEQQDANRREADAYFRRMNACVAEIRDRERAMAATKDETP